VTSRAGVTSKAGLAAGLAAGVMRTVAPPRPREAGDMGHLLGAALLDRDREAVLQRPVDRRRGQGDVEGHAGVGGERLQVGADLVADVAAGGGAVGPGDDEIDEPALHQVPAGIVDDDRVRHAVIGELPRRQRRALVARPGLVDPDMDRDPAVVGEVDRRRRRADVDRREPAGVAMGEDAHRLARGLAGGDRLDQRHPVLADRRVDRHVLVADRRGEPPRLRRPRLGGERSRGGRAAGRAPSGG
jgi:hypothetical protein